MENTAEEATKVQQVAKNNAEEVTKGKKVAENKAKQDEKDQKDKAQKEVEMELLAMEMEYNAKKAINISLEKKLKEDEEYWVREYKRITFPKITGEDTIMDEGLFGYGAWNEVGGIVAGGAILAMSKLAILAMAERMKKAFDVSEKKKKYTLSPEQYKLHILGLSPNGLNHIRTEMSPEDRSGIQCRNARSKLSQKTRS